MDVLDRARAAGFETLLVTVDVPVAGARLRDRYNGLTIPPSLGPGTILNAAPKVRWWFDFLTTEPLRFSTFTSFDGTVAELLDSMFDPTVDERDLVWIRNRWPGPVVVKGIQTLDDARRCADRKPEKDTTPATSRHAGVESTYDTRRLRGSPQHAGHHCSTGVRKDEESPRCTAFKNSR
jgi:isopentenyl diphosphate isomerase/L-lactate dehydrogenase-like FMN-dependent dehydrogenase